MTYGGGQLARGIGGGRRNLQRNPFDAESFGDIFRVPRSLPGNKTLISDSTFKDYLNSPIQEGGGLGEIFLNKKNAADLTKEVLNPRPNIADIAGDGIASKTPLGKFFSKVGEYVPTSLGQLNPLGKNFDPKKAGGAFLLFKGVQKLSKMAPQETVSAIMGS